MIDQLSSDNKNSAYVYFAKRYKPRNASLAQQQEKLFLRRQIVVQKKDTKSRYLTPIKSKTFQNRITEFPTLNKLNLSSLYSNEQCKKTDPYFKDWDMKCSQLLCGTLRKLDSNREKKLYDKSFSQEEQLEMIKQFKEKPPLQAKKPQIKSPKNRDLDKDFAINDISQYFYKIQD